jgi:uncharacterized protein YjbI with pentapeptide repeats
MNKVSQEEMKGILQRHSLWLLASTGGERAMLAGCDLRGLDLSDANLAYANMAGCMLDNANLSRAVLSYANLADATLRGVNAVEASFDRANLSHAILARADLTNANLEWAICTQAAFTYAKMDGVRFYGITLVGAWFIGTSAIDHMIEAAKYDLKNAQWTLDHIEEETERQAKHAQLSQS